nr:uncharacterized protein LOC109734240 [Aegilops tauschii subsp. strangulata]
MDIYKDQDDEETEDAATSKADDDEDVPQKTTGRKGRTSSRRVSASKLNLDLELAKQNLQKAKDEAAAMGDEHSENRKLQARLKNVISLDKMKQALEQKDLDLAAARKTAREKTNLANKKLASVDKLEEENAKLKTAVGEANKEVVQLKKDKVALTDKVADLTRKRDELEAYLGGLAKKYVPYA